MSGDKHFKPDSDREHAPAGRADTEGMSNVPVLTPAEEKRTAAAGAINSAAYVICVLTGVLVAPLISRILPAADLGKAMSFSTTRDMLYIMLSLSVVQSVPLAMIFYRGEKRSYLSSVFMFTSVFIIGLFLVCLPFKSLLLPLFFGNEFLFYWLFAMLLLQSAVELMIAYVHFHNRTILSVAFTLLSYPIPVVLSVIFILNMPSDKYIGRIVGLDAFIFAAGFLCAVLLLVRGRLRFKTEHIKYALRVSLPLVPYALSAIMLVRSDILIITYYSGSEKSGLYMMAFTLANLLFACLQQVINFWSPWVYRRLAEGDYNAVKSNTRPMAALAFTGAVGLMCAMPEAVRLFIAAEYAESIVMIAPITVGIFFNFINKLFFDIEYFNRKNVFIAIASIAAAALSIGLNFALIGQFGYVVCAVTTAVSYAFLTVLHLWYTRRLDVSKIYPVRAILAYAGVLTVLAVAIHFLLDAPLLRWALMLITLGVTAFIERGAIMPLLAKLKRKK